MFEDTFGFRPPVEPLLAPVFLDGEGEPLDDYVLWTAPEAARIAPPASLAAMKLQAFPERDKSHKQLNDLVDLHALFWYVEECAAMRLAVRNSVPDADLEPLRAAVSEGLYEQATNSVGVDSHRSAVDRTAVCIGLTRSETDQLFAPIGPGLASIEHGRHKGVRLVRPIIASQPVAYY